MSVYFEKKYFFQNNTISNNLQAIWAYIRLPQYGLILKIAGVYLQSQTFLKH
jgi:hypothetical protein